MNAADIAQIAAGIFGVTGFGAGLAAYFKGRAQTREVEIGGVNALRSDDRKRISELENNLKAEREHCEKKFEAIYVILREQDILIFATANSVVELSAVVERHEPANPALARAKIALARAFPVRFTDDADLMELAREVVRKTREDRK